MIPTTITIQNLFQMESRFMVPLFQRPYVWMRERQWEPLWRDIAAKADQLIENKGKKKFIPRQHFLGAVVLNQVQTYGMELSVHEVIDGQQRLTTLQIVLLAVRDYAQIKGHDNLKENLRTTTLNLTAASNLPDDRYKVWPTSTDRDVFKNVWNAGSPDILRQKYPLIKRKYAKTYEPRHPLVEAYSFFFDTICSYVEAPLDDNDQPLTLTPQEQSERLQLLFIALTKHLELVRIDLQPQDDPQVIFETLNARGEPLLPSDLARNFVFLEATHKDEDVEQLYTTYWQPYDVIDAQGNGFWKTIVRQGRLQRPRMDLFLYHYLACRTERDIVISHLFKEFQTWWLDEDRDVTTELQELQRYATVFQQLYSRDDADRLEVFARRLRVMDTSTFYPLLLCLLVEKADEIGGDRDAILTDLESYLVRRMMCGLTNKPYNRTALNLLRAVRKIPKLDHASFHSLLAGLQGDTARWPSDAEFRKAWKERPIYTLLNVQRVIMILEALEWQQHTAKQEVKPFTANPYSVEHLLPQNPAVEDWPLSIAADADQPARDAVTAYRDQLKHTFGNLTLVTQPLNSALSNGPFSEKLKEIQKHGLLKLHTYFAEHGITNWNEDRIIERGDRLFALACEVWPGPDAM